MAAMALAGGFLATLLLEWASRGFPIPGINPGNTNSGSYSNQQNPYYPRTNIPEMALMSMVMGKSGLLIYMIMNNPQWMETLKEVVTSVVI
jgi:hypothetical protein